MKIFDFRKPAVERPNKREKMSIEKRLDYLDAAVWGPTDKSGITWPAEGLIGKKHEFEQRIKKANERMELLEELVADLAARMGLGINLIREKTLPAHWEIRAKTARPAAEGDHEKA